MRINKSYGTRSAVVGIIALLIAPIVVFAGEPAQQDKQRPSTEKPEASARPDNGVIVKDEMLTLARCVDIALRKNPSIMASAGAVETSRSRVGQARSNYYPQLSAQAAYNRISPMQGAASGALQAYDQYSGSVNLAQNLLDFGRTFNQVDISKYNLDASRSDLRATQDAVILNVKQAYYGVLLAKRNLDVAADVIKQYQLHLDQAKGFYDVGTKARIDVIKAEVDLSNAKLSIINAENALKIAWVVLNNAIGAPDAPEYRIEDILSFQKYSITLEEATAKALENRPDLRSIDVKRQASETNISLARSGYYPALTGNANYNWTGDAPSALDHGWSAGVVLTVPLFSGMLTSNQTAEAKANLYVVKANEEALRQQVLLEVRQAFLNLQAAEAAIATAELAAQQAKENLDLANGRYGAGVGSPVEVSDAFATYVAAQANHTAALSNYKLAQASIEKAMGVR
jgi:outer membrane protein